MTFDESKSAFKWRWSGEDWAERGKTRQWIFPKHRVCHELEINIMDCDGDFAPWSVANKTTGLRRQGEGRDQDEAWVQIEVALAQFMEDGVNGE